MESRPAGLTLVERQSVSQLRPDTASRTATAVRALILGVLLVVAYRYSWLTLFRSPSGSLVGLAAAATLGVAVAARGRDADEPSIHDRYTDFIVGVPLLGSALAILVLLPDRLSVFFWFNRLDLISLPLFTAGGIALLFGIRAFWRLGFSILAIFLLWALREAPLLSTPTLAVLATSCGLAVWLAIRRPERRLPTSFRSAVSHPRSAAVVVLVLAAAATIESGSLDRYQPVLLDSGQPRIVRTSDFPSIGGWTRTRTGEFPWVRSYISADASWSRFVYMRGKTPGLLVDDISSSRQGPIVNASLPALYRIHGFSLSQERALSLGSGVVGHDVVYVDAAGTHWNAVYWDWPVESSAGIRYERIVVTSERIADAPTSLLTNFATLFVAGSAR